MRRNSVDSSNVEVRALENLNKDFSRYSALNLSARKVAKRIEQVVKNTDDKNSIGRDSPLKRRDVQKLESMKNTLTKDINSIKEAIATISSSPKSYKRKQSNILNEDRAEFAIVDLTINLCDIIRQDDDEANDKDMEEVPNVKRRKLSEITVNN